MNLLIGFVVAALLSVTVTPLLLRGAGGAGARVGGIAMGLASLLPLLFWLPIDAALEGYLTASVTLLVVGAIDDRYTLGPATRALGQLVAVTAFMTLSGVQFDSFVLVNRVELPYWLGFATTLLFLMAATNAVQLADGLDSLAGGLALLTCVALALLAQRWQQSFALSVAVLLGGAIFGFLRFNTWPPRVPMGVAGGQFLGFSVGALAVYLVQDGHTPLSAMPTLFLVGLPLVDLAAVQCLRVMGPRSPLGAADRHLHRRLLSFGLVHYEAVAVLYALQCLMLLLAWELREVSDVLILAVFVVIVQLAVTGVGILEERGWRWRGPRS